LETIAFGQLGLSEDHFWSMTPRTFFNALDGWTAIYRTDLEIRRLQTLYAVNVLAKNPINDPEKLWKYPWETKIFTEDQIQKQIKRGKALAEKIKKQDERKNSRSTF
jgi:hypothetical protein